MQKPSSDDISIRTELRPGDIGYIIYLHGKIYSLEFNYGISFETYVAAGLQEFYQEYNTEKDMVWIAEHMNRIIGCLFLVHRKNSTAQLRYFLIEPFYRGIGLGTQLMDLYMEFLEQKEYTHSYLWTTNEQRMAADLYKRKGFVLTEEKSSTVFGKPVTEQRYDWKKGNDVSKFISS